MTTAIDTNVFLDSVGGMDDALRHYADQALTLSITIGEVVISPVVYAGLAPRSERVAVWTSICKDLAWSSSTHHLKLRFSPEASLLDTSVEAADENGYCLTSSLEHTRPLLPIVS